MKKKLQISANGIVKKEGGAQNERTEKKKNNIGTNILISLAAPMLVLLGWHYITVTGTANQAILPSISKVVTTAVTLIQNGKLAGHLLISFQRVLKGFAIGASSGVVLGTLMGYSKFFNRFLGSLVGIFRPVPMIAWIPLLILWLGIGEQTKVTLIALGSFWSVLLNTIHGIQSVDYKLLEVAQALKKNKISIIFRVILPSAIPSIITGLRLGIGVSWSCVVAAEMIAASKGMGYMITYARETSKPAEVLVGVFIIGLIGLLIDTVLLRIQKKLVRWNAL